MLICFLASVLGVAAKDAESVGSGVVIENEPILLLDLHIVDIGANITHLDRSPLSFDSLNDGLWLLLPPVILMTIINDETIG